MKVFKKHEQGTVLLYVAGSLIVMLLFVGLAIDGGWTTYVRNQGQAAVDAAALLDRIMRTGERPTTLWEHPPLMWPPTGTGPHARLA